MLFVVATVSLALALGPAADVKGKWQGTLVGTRLDGSEMKDTALLILEQKDTTVTGTVGGNESDRHPIPSGTVEGNKLTITAKNAQDGREYRLELMVDGEEMKGTMSMGERQANLLLKRLKQ